MPILNPRKVEKLPYKIYKAVTKHVKKRKQKPVEQLVVPIRAKTFRRHEETNETYIRIFVNNLIVTNSNGNEDATLQRETHYGIFINSPVVTQNKSIVVSEHNKDFLQRAYVNIGPIPRHLKRSRSLDSLLTEERSDIVKLSSHSIRHDMADIRDSIATETKSNKYAKYIPVNDKMGDVYSRSDIDSKAPLSWLDLQIWFSEYLEETEKTELYKCKSLTAVDDCNGDLKWNKCNEKRLNEDDIENNFRFGERNKNYLLYASMIELDSSDTSIEVLIQMRDGDSYAISRMKIDMISKCLYNFFMPFGENIVTWVDNVQFEIERKLLRGQRDLFGRKVETENVKAVISLDPEPAALLRHKDLCILDTIAKIMEIKLNELLIFQNVYKN